MKEQDIRQARQVVANNFIDVDSSAVSWMQDTERLGALLNNVDVLIRDFNERSLHDLPERNHNTRLVKARFKKLPTIHALMGIMKRKELKSQFGKVVVNIADEVLENRVGNVAQTITSVQPERIRIHHHRKHTALERVLQFYEGIVLSESFFSVDEVDRRRLSGKVINMFVEIGSFHPKNDVAEQMIRADRLNWLETRSGLNEEFIRSARTSYQKSQNKR